MRMKLSDLNLLDIGNTIQLSGVIYTGQGLCLMALFPDESLDCVVKEMDPHFLCMDEADWERLLNQTDQLNVEGPAKAILRKSQRQIDQAIAWNVYHRDGYLCRYCGERRPLTVDHVIRWENGGATVEGNLVSACRRCNKTRGNMEYDEWLQSEDYGLLSQNLSEEVRYANAGVAVYLDRLRAIKAKPRSR